MFYKDTGECRDGVIYDETLTPPAHVVPSDCSLVHFDETHPDYALMVALFVGPDLDGISLDYAGVPPKTVVKYDFTTTKFVFTKPVRFTTLEMVRMQRNAELSNCDHLLSLPDLPEELKQKTLEYRQKLRDITEGADSSWDFLDYPWPEIPSHH